MLSKLTRLATRNRNVFNKTKHVRNFTQIALPRYSPVLNSVRYQSESIQAAKNGQVLSESHSEGSGFGRD